MLSEETLIDQVTAQWIDPTPGDPTMGEDPQPGRYVINVRRSTRVLRDGAIIAKENHRHVVELTQKDASGKDVPADLKDEDPIVQKIAAAVKERPPEVTDVQATLSVHGQPAATPKK